MECYLSGNNYVVQYKLLRYKQEPIVYLFEVNVETAQIVRGINNNAIELLAGKNQGSKNTRNTAKLKVNKAQIKQNIDSDDEMF